MQAEKITCRICLINELFVYYVTLRSKSRSYFCDLLLSHPARGGWIEIRSAKAIAPVMSGPTPHGVGGLKYFSVGCYTEMHYVPPRTGWVD